MPTYRALVLGAAAAACLALTGTAAAAPSTPDTTTAAKTVPAAAPKMTTINPAVTHLAADAHITLAQAQTRITAQQNGAKVADRLGKQLGTKFGGAYFTPQGRLVIAVTDRTAANTAARPGVTVRIVRHSQAALNAAKAKLDKGAKVGTVTQVDVIGNRVTRTVEKVNTLAWTAGGVAIYHVGGGRCSSGFNVKLPSGSRYTLTAGHCGVLGGNWQNWDGGTLGPVAGAYFPGRDFGAIYQTGAASPALPGVYLYNGYYQPTWYAANPYVGQYLCRSGSTTGVHCGYVTALNATVTYPQGTVVGTIRTNICAEPGDSGGSLFNGVYGYGMTSGGSGNCSSGGTTFFQPLTYALSYWGLSLI